MIQLKYFGIIAELTACSGENLEQTMLTVSGLKTLLQNKYPSMADLQFAVAVNHCIAEDGMRIPENSEVALLPPYAGG
jgi:molybdopterin synthase sulfur carrier subunit